MSAGTRSPSPSVTTTFVPTTLREHFIQYKARPLPKDVPRLNESLLKRARNCVPRSEENNDLLEFIGDRAVNLICAILVEDVKLSKAHHETVSRRVSNNDTFGRISYCLRFHEHAELNQSAQESVDKWDPHLSTAPPKVLADLFEAYAGAILIQHGWKRLRYWLERVFKPIIKLATADYWFANSGQRIFGEPVRRRWRNEQLEPRIEDKLLDYINFKRDFMESKGREVVDMLPSKILSRFDKMGHLQEPDCDRVEVALHLVNMWVCRIIIQLWPEYHFARAKAAHMLTGITRLVTGDQVMAYLAELLSLSKFCGTSPGLTKSTLVPRQQASILRASIGWMYQKDPEAADTWGLAWLGPVVLRAHDILTDEHGYRPRVMKDRRDLPLETTRLTRTQDSEDSDKDDMLSSLIQGLGSLEIKSEPKRPTKTIAVVSVSALSDKMSSLSVSLSVADSASNGHSANPLPLEGAQSTKPSKWRPIGRPSLEAKMPSSNTPASESFASTGAHKPSAAKVSIVAHNTPEQRDQPKDCPTPRIPEASHAAKWKPIGCLDKDSNASTPKATDSTTVNNSTISGDVYGSLFDSTDNKENVLFRPIASGKHEESKSRDVVRDFTQSNASSSVTPPVIFMPRSLRIKVKARAPLVGATVKVEGR